MTRKHAPVRPRTRTVLWLAALTLLITGAVLNAGPLNPPAGPIASTSKTLAEVEPRTAINSTNTPGDAASVFKITQPGSYYLTADPGLISAGKHGILIAASNVTVDLNGFQIWGLGSAPAALDGVSAAAGTAYITVRNGIVRNMNGDGIDLSAAPDSFVENIRSHNNNGSGIILADRSRAQGCVTRQCAVNGISCGTNGLIDRCNSSGNTGMGIRVGYSGILLNCSADSNTVNGMDSGSDSVVSGCTAKGNGIYGIFASFGSAVSNCSATGNGTAGISLSIECIAVNCTTRANTGDGINAGASCLLRDNTCSGNGVGAGTGAGIHVYGAGTRIEGNNCNGSNRGIWVASAGNIVIRNTCSGNTTNWFIISNNIWGPVIDRTAPASVGFTTNSAASTLGSTDPNANFTY